MPYSDAHSPQQRLRTKKRNTKAKIKALVAPKLTKEEWEKLNKLLDNL